MVYKIDYYESDGDNYRYIIGTKGEHTLIAIGVNPNTATDKNPDKTISKTIEFSIRNGYDSFIAVNLYPQRAKFPKDLDKQEFQNQIQKNLDKIELIVPKLKKYDIVCAWGNSILLRPYLQKSARDIMGILSKNSGSIFMFGNLTEKGHPRHLSRLGYSNKPEPFTYSMYLEKLGV